MVEALFGEEFSAGFAISVGNTAAIEMFADDADGGAEDIRKRLQKIGQEMKIIGRNGKEQFKVLAVVERVRQRIRHSFASRG